MTRLNEVQFPKELQLDGNFRTLSGSRGPQ